MIEKIEVIFLVPFVLIYAAAAVVVAVPLAIAWCIYRKGLKKP